MCNFEIPLTIPETNQTFIVTPATTVRKNFLIYPLSQKLIAFI